MRSTRRSGDTEQAPSFVQYKRPPTLSGRSSTDPARGIPRQPLKVSCDMFPRSLASRPLTGRLRGIGCRFIINIGVELDTDQRTIRRSLCSVVQQVHQP